LTTAVLVNSSSTTGYNTSSTTPGQFQRYAERYLQHLQIPYDIFDVASTPPPSDLNSRQLIIAGHPGLQLSSLWQSAIVTAVNGGTGFVNLDSSSTIGTQSHIQTIFGATGSALGTPATQIVVPAAMQPGGSTPHYIAGLQRGYRANPGDFVYPFHANQSGVVNSVTATALQNANGTVVALMGTDPLIRVTTYGAGRAVFFGTLDYLQADRFGFLMGVDDLFWRSLVWAARKPFVLRGYPRFWSVRMDHNVDTGWPVRIKEMYDPTLTGNVAPDGSGGPWKVSGSIYMNLLPPGDPNRALLNQDINAGKIQVSPHGYHSVDFGDLFWNGPAGRANTDSEWVSNMADIQAWKQGNGGTDTIPFFSKWVLGHFYDLSNNMGYDFWNTFGFRYIGTTIKPGFQYNHDPLQYNGAERLQVRPFWIYQLPPLPQADSTSDESYSFFFADDLTMGSRAGLPSQKFFLFGSRSLDIVNVGPVDMLFCNSDGSGLPFAESKFQWYTWRLFSSMVPVEVYTHDDKYAVCPDPQRRQLISDISGFLNTEKAQHIFMQDMSQYTYARTKSTLSQANYNGSQITYTYTGAAMDLDGVLVPTKVLVFSGDTEGQWQGVSGFSSGLVTSMAPPPAPPAVVAVNPSTGSIAGGTSITISGAGFTSTSTVTIGRNNATNVSFHDSSTLTAVTPAGTEGTADVAVFSQFGSGTLTGGFTYVGPPGITRISPTAGPSTGGNIMNLFGNSFVSGAQVTVGGQPATNITVISPSMMAVTIPAGTTGTVANVKVTTPNGSSTLNSAYSYLDPSTVLMEDSFNGDSTANWLASPLGLAQGWSRVQGAYDYAGLGGTQQFTGNAGWGNYSVEAKVQVFSLANFPGGFRGRVNPSTGAGYAVWFYPGSNVLRLLKATAWNIDAPGLTVLGSANLTYDTTNYHRVQLVFQGTSIQVFWDGVIQISATDSSYASGLIALDVSNQHIRYEDVLVTGPPSTGPFITGLTVAPASFTLNAVGVTKQLTVTASYSDGTNQNVTTNSGTNYSSGNSNSLSVGSTGLVTAVSNGSSTINATFGAWLASTAGTVQVTVPTALRVSPYQGTTAGGNRMDLMGMNLSTATTVNIGGHSASILSAAADGSQMTVLVPSGSVGSADIVLTNSGGSSTFSGGYTYVDPLMILFADDFNLGSLSNWTASPLGLLTNWSATQHVADNNGGGATQIYAGSSAWSNYAVEAKFQLFSNQNYPGGLRGRVNTSTGASYTVWLYPSSLQIRLLRTGAWSVDAPGLAVLSTTSVASMNPNVFHKLKLVFSGSQITVLYDGATVIQATDTALTAGAIALDVSNQHIQFDDVFVSSSVPAPTLTGITVSPVSFTLTSVGATQQLTVTASYSDGSTQNVTSNSGTTYAPSNTASSTVSATGLVTAVNNGTSIITASFGAFQGTTTATVNVTAPAISRVSPTQGTTAGGNRMDLMGTNLSTNSTVKIGGQNASVLSALPDGSRMTVQVPPGSLGSANIVVTNAGVSTTLAGGYTYVDPLTILFADDFNLGSFSNWTPSPLGLFSNWTASQDLADYNGGGHTQIYAGNPGWADYSAETKFQLFSNQSYPGGLRGRVNTSTGASYAVWLYPASLQIKLLRTGAWSVDAPGLAVLSSVSVANMDPNVFHRVKLVFSGSLITVVYDGATVLQVSDATLTSGAVALDVSSQHIQFEDIIVTQP